MSMSKQAKALTAILVVAGVLMICGCIGLAQMFTGEPKASVSTSSPPVVEKTSGPASATTPAAAPSPAAKVWTAGMYKVGSEIPAGSYVTTASGHCYWERLKNDSGDFDSIIANENLSDGERGRVGVKATDRFVKFTGDCEWRRA